MANNLSWLYERRRCSRVVIAANQSRRRLKRRVRKVGVELGRDCAFDEAEDFPPLLIRAEIAGGCVEADLLKIPEQFSRERGVRLLRTTNGVTHTNDAGRPPTSFEANLAHLIHSSFEVPSSLAPTRPHHR